MQVEGEGKILKKPVRQVEALEDALAASGITAEHEPGTIAIIEGSVDQRDFNDKACIVVREAVDATFPSVIVKCMVEDCPEFIAKTENLRTVTAKDAARYVSAEVGDFKIKGTPQGISDNTRPPVFLVSHNGEFIGLVAASSKRGRSLFDAFEIALKVCHDIQDGPYSRQVFLDVRAKYMT